jgi:ketosteroid isomerase-like protein
MDNRYGFITGTCVASASSIELSQLLRNQLETHMNYQMLVKLFVSLVLVAFLPCHAAEVMTPQRIEQAYVLYNKAWTEVDDARRASYIEQIWAKNGVLKDPSTMVVGRESLLKHIGKFIHDFPNTQITRISKIDSFGTSFRVAWKMAFANGTSLEGVDIGEMDDDGRIKSITGFWQPLPLSQIAENQSIVMEYFESLFRKGDLVAVEKLVAKDAVYTQASGLPYGGRYTGFEEWKSMFGKVNALVEIHTEGDPVLLTSAQADRIILQFAARFTSRKSEKEIELPISEQFDIANGKIVSVQPYYFDTKSFSDFLAK